MFKIHGTFPLHNVSDGDLALSRLDHSSGWPLNDEMICEVEKVMSVGLSRIENPQ